VRALLGPD
jgi:hypothetical protein